MATPSRPEEGPDVTAALRRAGDATTFGRHYAPGAPYHRSLRELHAALAAVDPGGSLPARSEMLERLARWVRKGGTLPAIEGSPRLVENPAHIRLRLLLRVLREHPTWRAAVAATLASVIAETQTLHLFAEVGVPNTRGIWSETSDRLARRLLPQPRDDEDFARVLSDLFPKRSDAVWLAGLSPELAEEAAHVLSDGRDLAAPLREGVVDAVRLLVTRVSSLGLTEELRARSHKSTIVDSPFFRLPRAADAWIDSRTAENADAVRARMDECRVELSTVLESLERSGVSVDVVYRVEVIEQCLERIDVLLPLVSSAGEGERAAAGLRALVVLVQAGAEDHSIRGLLRSNLHLLARKIVERVGETGEHYITTTRREYGRMFRSAVGGGLLTVGTASMKILVGAAHYAPFVEGFLAGLNYALSFLILQIFHFVLATKQPSATAAALAHAIHRTHDNHDPRAGHEPDLDALATVTARITRSQLCAALGNILAVTLGCILFDFVHREVYGRPFLDAKKAAYVIDGLHPTKSGTIWYATLTGIILWAASIVAGWVENWAVYRRLPEAIAQHRAGGRLLGKARMERISRWFVHHVAGIGGNVSLGFLLGMTPIVGRFFGLPLDVRHVTLSTGTLALAGSAVGPSQVLEAPFLMACAGIGVIFVLNLSVSFFLALAVALRARGVARRLPLLRAVVVRFFRRPAEFFIPPKA